MYLYCKTILLLHIIKLLKLNLQFQPITPEILRKLVEGLR